MWKRFYFESNMFFDSVEGPSDWERLKAAYPNKTDEELLDAKESYDGTLSAEHRKLHPNYGLRFEHDGVRRLRDFFEENDMLRLLPGQDAKDAARYRWLRKQHWTSGTLSVVKPSDVQLCADCPSGQRLDKAIDKFTERDNVSESIEPR